MFSDDFPEFCEQQPLAQGRLPFVIHLYVPDADAAFARATGAGCTVVFPIAGQFWGGPLRASGGPLRHALGHRHG